MHICTLQLRSSISLKICMWTLMILRVLSLHNDYLMLAKERTSLWITSSHTLSTWSVARQSQISSQLFILTSRPERHCQRKYYLGRAILCLRNSEVDEINEEVIKTFPGEERLYSSANSIKGSEEGKHHPVEYLNCQGTTVCLHPISVWSPISIESLILSKILPVIWTLTSLIVRTLASVFRKVHG